MRLRCSVALGNLAKVLRPTTDAPPVVGVGLSKFDSHTALLFHGPSSQSRAGQEARAWGRVLGVFGTLQDGLDTETVREAVSALTAPPVGDQRGSVVIGPVDLLTRADVVDALLKVLEEGHHRLPRCFLWATDVGGVRPTIRSRCLMEWCPGQVVIPADVLRTAEQAVRLSKRGDGAGVISTLGEVRDVIKADVGLFVSAIADVVLREPDEAGLALWGRMRPLTWGQRTYAEVLSELLP
jgi:hypothetical protein